MARVVASLFDIHGRLSRGGLLIFVVCLMPVMLLAMWFIVHGLIDAAFFALLLVSIISLFAVIRRLHDRNRSGWWIVFIFGVPFLIMWSAREIALRYEAVIGVAPDNRIVVMIGAAIALLPLLWAAVELYFLPGTKGPNRFGADPREA